MHNVYERPLTAHGVAFIGNYLPRKCGIATFTYDLAEAVATVAGRQQPVSVCAMNDIIEGYEYPDRVKFEIRQDFPGDYLKAADFLNFSRTDVVSLQHEYGIFGGEEGSHLLALMQNLRRPVVVTCHTVRKDPLPSQVEVLTEIAARAKKLVVMSQRAVRFLEEIYRIDTDKIVHIPHGIHDVPFIDPSYYKDKFGVEGRRVLLTFGLLSRRKGIETVIEALPTVISRHPKVIYLVLGATHPCVLQFEGESYRMGLQRRVRELGLEDHVMFLPQFVEVNELMEYIGACDLFVTPYHALDQITSGVLSYAMGAGKAVISTPYWHAEELLADGRGRLVPVADAAAVAAEINQLLDDEVALSAMRKRAYHHCRNSVWSSVARDYLRLFDEVRGVGTKYTYPASHKKKPLRLSDLPTPKLDHLYRLSDDTGPAHHARHRLPDWNYGYWLEDAAYGLVAAAKYYDVLKSKEAIRFAEKCLCLLRYMVSHPQGPVSRLDYTRKPLNAARDVDLARTIWAAGYAVSHGPSIAREYANDVFNILVSDVIFSEMKPAAYAILGAADYLRRFEGAVAIRRYLHRSANTLFEQVRYDQALDRWDGPDRGIAVQALAVAAQLLDLQSLGDTAIQIGNELLAITDQGRVFLRRGENPNEEEVPIFAMTFIEALGALYGLSRDQSFLKPMRSAVDWFLGSNSLGEALYDFSSGGCSDALTAGGLNHNQGAEATASCLIAFLTLYELIGSDLITGAEAS